MRNRDARGCRRCSIARRSSISRANFAGTGKDYRGCPIAPRTHSERTSPRRLFHVEQHCQLRAESVTNASWSEVKEYNVEGPKGLVTGCPKTAALPIGAVPLVLGNK